MKKPEKLVDEWHPNDKYIEGYNQAIDDREDRDMTIQQKCPICEGHGIVMGGFYSSLPNSQGITTVLTEPCRNCGGSGVIYVEQDEKQIGDTA